jgi:hypothetical protein
MAQVVYKGFFNDLESGAVADGATVYCMGVMSNTTTDTEYSAEVLSDFTDIDEMDCVGYAQAALTNFTVTQVTNQKVRLDCDDFNLDGGGDIVQTCTRQSTRLLFFRYISGSTAVDVPWFSIDVGPFTPAGGPFDVAVDTTGLLIIG